MNKINVLRLVIKTVCLFILANLVFALWNPPVGRISGYNLVFPGRTRLPFGGGLADFNISVDDLDAMFASHAVAAPKSPDEFRVILLGDSSIWGELLEADQTLSAGLNRLGLTCHGKSVRFYNLGYPHPSVVKDLLFADYALQYQPDAVLWALTPSSLMPKPANPFLLENSGRIQALANKYGLPYPYEQPAAQAQTLLDRSFIGQRDYLSRLVLLQSLGIYWGATGIDLGPVGQYKKLSNDQDDNPGFGRLQQPQDMTSSWLLNYLDAGTQMRPKMPVLFFNEPMYIGLGKHSQVRYNTLYPRWAYDQYRQSLQSWATAGNRAYLDLWDSVPQNYFTDNPLHLSLDGESLLAQKLKAFVQQNVCP